VTEQDARRERTVAYWLAEPLDDDPLGLIQLRNGGNNRPSA